MSLVECDVIELDIRSTIFIKISSQTRNIILVAKI